MTAGEFSVRQYFADGDDEDVIQHVDAETAMRRVVNLTHSVGGQIGTTARVIIIDGGDCICFDWKFGLGVIFPPPPS